eukprot:53108-Amorphochlora_amoeboformis.AAC.1
MSYWDNFESAKEKEGECDGCTDRESRQRDVEMELINKPTYRAACHIRAGIYKWQAERKCPDKWHVVCMSSGE